MSDELGEDSTSTLSGPTCSCGASTVASMPMVTARQAGYIHNENTPIVPYINAFEKAVWPLHHAVWPLH